MEKCWKVFCTTIIEELDQINDQGFSNNVFSLRMILFLMSCGGWNILFNNPIKITQFK